MGAVSQVLSTDGKDVKASRGNENNVTARHFTAAGDDSHPLPGDYCALSSASGTGRQTAVGYMDKVNPPKAAPGEKRIYARDESGAVVCEMWLKNSGEINISTESSGADVVINGVRIPADGSDVILPNGRSIMLHQHPQGNDSGGNTEKPTGDTIP